jgi:hypothetical protein
VEGDVMIICVCLSRLVSIFFKVQLPSIARNKISIHTNKKNKKELWIQKDEYSIEIKNKKELITKVREKKLRQTA